MRDIPREEVLTHNATKDCWIIIHNNVYDVTNFLQQHPGGKEILMTRAGEDATSYFQTKHGNNAAIKKRLERYKIGELPAAQKVDEKAFDEPFLQELIARCHKEKLYKADIKIRQKFFVIRFSLVTLFALIAFFVWYTPFIPLGIAIALVVIQAIIGTSLFGLIAHEHTHRNYPKNKMLRALLRIFWPVFWPFITQTFLRYEHNSHHVKIGDAEYDYEVAGFSKFIRYSGTVEYQPLNKYQHRFARMVYPFYANIITTIGGIFSSYWGRHNKKVGWEHSLSILTTFTFYIFLPALILGGLWKCLLLYFVYQCCLFYGIYIGAAINHFIPPIIDKIPDEYKNYYAYYVCANTSNFSAKNPFWFYYTGGFNIQIEHHLIPTIPVENLRKLIPIVQGLCEKYNYPYIDYKTFKELWRDHYAYLKVMSENTDNVLIRNEVANKQSYQAR